MLSLTYNNLLKRTYQKILKEKNCSPFAFFFLNKPGSVRKKQGKSGISGLNAKNTTNQK